MHAVKAVWKCASTEMYVSKTLFALIKVIYFSFCVYWAIIVETKQKIERHTTVRILNIFARKGEIPF